MPTKLGDLEEFYDPGLTVPIRGREYTLPLASAEVGLWCRRMAVLTGELHGASSEQEMRAAAERLADTAQLPGDVTVAQYLLGDVYDQMVADGVEDAYIEFCGMTAYFQTIAGTEAAIRFYQSGGRPEAAGPNRAARRAASRTGETSTAAATGTRSRANTSGTTSRPTSARPKKPRKSAG
ncbi:DUF7426 family protein [Actinoplanes aureus]|uniref:DUF7426 domain-containing protein n=1 Tax=Actinoplanes aureus TaxID=2792083 RepID=A0A931FUY3_9ACTN|nr:hypothetical protein [Actinoplanes aureus]MBG0560728.1 hypothetical protein [Actinoplanes aureus]